MKRRAAIVGVIAGVATAVASAALASTVRCIDSPVFYYPQALIWASLGVAAIAAGAAMTPAPAGRRVAIPLLVIGVVLLAIALVGPPYRTCAQFEIFR
jgi:cell division protein FtsW (lipid II flippase)